MGNTTNHEPNNKTKKPSKINKILFSYYFLNIIKKLSANSAPFFTVTGFEFFMSACAVTIFVYI
jgi:hypothetical protein